MHHPFSHLPEIPARKNKFTTRGIRAIIPAEMTRPGTRRNMSNEKVILLNPEHPIPTKALRRILKEVAVPVGALGIPEPGAEDLARARATVDAWLFAAERELVGRSPGVAKGLAEIDPEQAAFGVCPYCLGNDGHLSFGDDHWGVCHQHGTRWRFDTELLEKYSFRMNAGDSIDDEECPVRGYFEVDPVMLLTGQGGGEGGYEFSRSAAVGKKRHFPPEGPAPRGVAAKVTQLGKDVILLLFLPLLLVVDAVDWVRGSLAARAEE